jgi:hypothetical protein
MKDDLKDMVLSTLAEIGEFEKQVENETNNQNQENSLHQASLNKKKFANLTRNFDEKSRDLRLELSPNERTDAEIRSIQTTNKLEKSEFYRDKLTQNQNLNEKKPSQKNKTDDIKNSDILEETKQTEIEFLFSIKERLEVLFEGLKQSENKQLEAKLNLTLSFLEYSLLKIDERLNQN